MMVRTTKDTGRCVLPWAHTMPWARTKKSRERHSKHRHHGQLPELLSSVPEPEPESPPPLPPETQRRLLVVAMSRSGHNAITQWIIQQFPRGTTIHRNNLEPMKRIRRGRRELPHHDIRTLDEVPLVAIRSEKEYSQCDRLIIVNRDPYNWLASRLRRTQTWGWLMPTVSLVSEYLSECLGDTHQLDRPFVDINYNRWFQDIVYRQKLAAALGVQFSDRGLLGMPGNGGGSTFDGFRFKRKANRMRVFDRWQVYRDDPYFRSLLPPELHELSRRYFGETEAWRFFSGNIQGAQK